MFAPKKVRLAEVEGLESRIAPALLVAGANLLGGSGNPDSGETSIGSSSVELVKVLSGQAIVWYDGIAGHITGISFGPDTRLEITGDIFGDVVGNLTSSGLLSDSDHNPANGEDGGILLSNNLLSLTSHPLGNQNGDVAHIVTGGSIANVSIAGEIRGIMAGDGVFRPESSLGGSDHFTVAVGIDANPVLLGEQTSFDFAKSDAIFQAGANISKVTVGTARSLEIIAGNGDPNGLGSNSTAGHAGGSVKGVKIKSAYLDPDLSSATTSYSIFAGSGGKGSAGGAGGSIRNVVESQAAVSATLTAGHGGEGVNGRGGAGGNISKLDLQSDSTSYTIAAGDGGMGAPGGDGGRVQSVSVVGRNPNNALIVSKAVNIIAGNGGDGVDLGRTIGKGGGGGSVQKLSIQLESGSIDLVSGTGGDGSSGKGGTGGAISRIVATAQDGGFSAFTGNGGACNTGAFPGGAGGSMAKVRFTLNRPEEYEASENPVAITAVTGSGGASFEGIGGAGGSIDNLSLKVDGTDNGNDDGTIRASIEAGSGGFGASGGAGGSIRSLNTGSIHDNQNADGTIILTRFVLEVAAGEGGLGTNGNGGAGGSILQKTGDFIDGVTHADTDSPDPFETPLRIFAGSGGDGSVKGGIGGSIAGVVARNSFFSDGDTKTQPITMTHLFGAEFEAGDGGNSGSGKAGAGGGIQRSQVAVQGGMLEVFAGSGGSTSGLGKAKAGAGGSVETSYFGVVDSIFEGGLVIAAGAGGLGISHGGAGGSLNKIDLNAPFRVDGRSAELFAGDGGAASGIDGIGGKGGDIRSIAQSKDLNSAINILEAGRGGDSTEGIGGAGGSVIGIKTIGYIGKPSNSTDSLGLLDEFGLPQGLFAGRGGDGKSDAFDGVNGSASNVKARAIAAIAASTDPVSGFFTTVTKLRNVTASVIGYDVNGNDLYDSTVGPGGSPGSSNPVDGFVLAKAIAKVVGLKDAFKFSA